MKKGLELLRTRAYNKKPDLKKIKKNGIHLPPIYKLFFTYYKSGNFLEIFNLEKGDAKLGDYIFLSGIDTHNDVKIFDTLFGTNQIIRDNIGVFDYLRIGYIGNEVLLVGINDENEDKIFRHRFNDRTPYDLSYIKMGDNIFEYAHSFYECEINSEEGNSLFYKNWEEDFWRIRETEEKS